MKSYPPTWKGDLVLACRKCQKKMKNEHGMDALSKLKKTIKRTNKEHPDATLHVINVPCMDLCPKRAVTICVPSNGTVRLSVLRNQDGINGLYRRE